MADMTDMMEDEMIDPVTGEIIDQKDLAECLLALAREQGVSLVGPGGLLNQLTKERPGGGVERRVDRASGSRARWHADRGEHAQRHPRQDGVDRDRAGRDRWFSVIVTAPSSRSSSRNGSDVWTASIRSCCR